MRCRFLVNVARESRVAMLVRGSDKVAEQRVRLQRLRFELRMKLAAQEERVTRNLNDLDIRRVRCGAGQAQACTGEDGLVLPVELIPVTMAFRDLRRLVGLFGQ